MPVRRKPSGRWEARVSLGGGRRVEQTLPPGATRRDALALEAELVRRQIDAAAGRKPRRLIDEALQEWVDTSARQLKSYQRDLRYKIAALQTHYTAGRYLDELPAVAENVKRAGVGEVTPATVNRYLAILRRIGNLAVRWGWIDVPVGQRIELLPGERQRDALLTPMQVEAIALQADLAGQSDAADAIRFAALSGLRRGEQMRLRPEQVRDGVIWLDSSTKSGKPRVVPLPPQAIEIAERRLPWKVSYQMAPRHFQRAAAACGLAGVRWHDLRHAYGSWLIEAGASAAEVRDLLGHSSLVVTSRYLHASAQRLAAATSRLPSLRRA